jgi:hypothetical protein
MRKQPNDPALARELTEGGALVCRKGRVRSPIADDAPTASTIASKPNYIVDEKRTDQLGEIYSTACEFVTPIG